MLSLQHFLHTRPSNHLYRQLLSQLLIRNRIIIADSSIIIATIITVVILRKGGREGTILLGFVRLGGLPTSTTLDMA